MTLYSMFDASQPPTMAYPGCQAVMGYIGGNTPHVWTLEEWQRFEKLAQFPAWVGYQEADPAADAQQCVARMYSMGWEPYADYRRAVVVDEETEVNPAWIDTFAAEIWLHGYETFVYGSLYAVMKNPAKEGYLVADWNGVPAIPPYANVLGCQYQPNVDWDNTEVDLSVISSTMLSHAGYGPRK